MRAHKGMRPQDVAILLKILLNQSSGLQLKELANSLLISPSEVSESLNRSFFAGLITGRSRKVNRLALMDFIIYGLKYVFPQHPGAIVRGIPTAVSASPLNAFISSSETFVWPYAKGEFRGQCIVPLYPNLVEACLNDSSFYELCALTDAIRIGKSREVEMAKNELKHRILGE